MAIRVKAATTGELNGERRAAEHRDFIDRLVTVGIALAATAFSVVLISHLAYSFVFDRGVGFLNVEAENSSFSWASSVVTFFAGFAALLAALGGHRPRRYLALGIILAWFSFDDSVQVHERLGEWATTNVFSAQDDYAHALWLVVFFPLLGLAFLLLWQVSRELPSRGRFVLRAGLAGLVVGIGAEAATAALYIVLGQGAETVLGALEIAVEEGSELAGWILIATGLSVALSATISGAAGAREPDLAGRLRRLQ
jgi:hypothetical protein